MTWKNIWLKIWQHKQLSTSTISGVAQGLAAGGVISSHWGNVIGATGAAMMMIFAALHTILTGPPEA